MSAALTDTLPLHLAQRHGVVPVARKGGALAVATRGPLAPAAVEELAFLTGASVVPEVVDAGTWLLRWSEHYDAPPPAAPISGTPAATSHPAAPASSAARPSSASRQDLAPVPPHASATQIVQTLIARAAELGASDIHVEPREKDVRVRYRLDGALHRAATLPLDRRDAVVARLKVMASLDIAERRRPQDGKIAFRTSTGASSRTIDLRVSTLPTAVGEKVVLRLLDAGRQALDLPALGFGPDALGTLQRALALPHGMVLVTGPTGSGKTTTLYAALQTLDTDALNVMTIEDPVEYRLPGVNQVQVHPEIGYTFAAALRAALRQDPDVILVGEIRDEETARIAVRAALTGHLVLSTLHTNDAPSAVARLVDMGVEPYLVAAAVRLVVAQRLARCTCPSCAEPRPLAETDAEALGLSATATEAVGTGCDTCQGTGYKGRTALAELLEVSEPLAALVSKGADVQTLRAQAETDGFVSMRAAAAAAVARGQVPAAEVQRAGVAL